MKSISAFFLLFFAVAARAAGQSSVILDLEDLNKTMVTFERAFETKNPDALRAISHSNLQKSRFFRALLASMNCCRVNSAYSTRLARQEFDINGGRLTAEFVYRDEKWYLESATVDDRNLAPRGFSALASEYHFSDFRAAVLAGKIQQYAGLRFTGEIAKKPFTPKADTTITILNVLLHDGKTPTELLYLKLRKFPDVLQQRRGWLIEDAGSMLSFARQRNRDPLIEFLANGESYFDLEKPSAFAFVNIRESAAPVRPDRSSREAVKPPAKRHELNLKADSDKSSHTLKRVIARDFLWGKEGTSFTIAMELAGDAAQVAEWTSTVVGNTVRLETGPRVSISNGGEPHPYLDVHMEQNALVISIRRGLDSPVPTLSAARVQKITVHADDDVVHLSANVLIPRD